MEKTIWDYLYSKIGNAYGVAGLMGNLYAESGLNPKNMENSYERKLGYNDDTYTKAVDNGTYKKFGNDSVGYGLAQWTFYTRKQKLLAFANKKGTSISDVEMQLEFLINELANSYSSVFKTLKNAKSIKEASNKVLLKFERPADQGISVQNKRASYGQKYYDKFAHNKPVSPSKAPTNTNTLKYSKGAKIVLNGYLYKDSAGNGKGAKKTNYKGTITIVKSGASKPYHINKIGWVAESDIKLQSSSTTTYYLVKKGDNLTRIAETYNTTIDKLVELNNIKNKHKIYANQKLRVK